MQLSTSWTVGFRKYNMTKGPEAEAAQQQTTVTVAMCIGVLLYGQHDGSAEMLVQGGQGGG